MGNPWSGAAAGGNPWSSSSQSAGRSGGSWWNPIHALSSAYHAINPVGGLENLASGITKSFVHPVYGAAEGIGQLAAGGIEQLRGNSEAAKRDYAAAGGTELDVLQKGIIGGGLGFAQGFANLGSDIATPLGLGGQYDKLAAAPFHAIAAAMGQQNLGDETYHQLADFTPSTAQARGRKEGFLGAYGGDALLGAGAADVVAGTAGKIGDYQAAGATGADAAASAGTADTGAIADAAAAEAANGPEATAYKVRDAAHNVADALNWLPRGKKALTSSGGFLGLKTADLVAAMHQQAFPGEVTTPDPTLLASESERATPTTPEEQALARSTLAPTTAAAEAMAANAIDTRIEERGTTADKKVNLPRRTIAEEGNAPTSEEPGAEIDTQVQAARDVRSPTFVEDRLGNRLDMPAPAWAKRVAEFLPEPINRTLAHLNTPLTYFRMRSLANDLGHYIEMAQNHERSSPMHIAAEDAIGNLIATGTEIGQKLTRDQLSHMVGEEVSSRIEGASMLAEFARTEGKLASPEVIADMVKSTKRGYTGIPDALWEAMSPETHAAVDHALSDIVEQYKISSRGRLETMLASRYGAQGLERALIPGDEMPMTPDQTRLYRRSMDDFRRSAKLRERAVTERQQIQAETEKSVLFAQKADQAVTDLQARIGVNEATVESLHDPIPKGVVDADGTAQKMIEATLRDGGASFDVGSGRARAAEGYVVGLHQQFEIPLAEFQTDGVSRLVGAIRTPVGSDGGMYDPAALWSGPDAVLNTWVHSDASGTPVVTVDLGVASNGGAPLTEVQARVLGEAYNQASVHNPITGEDVTLSNDPAIQNLNGVYARDVLDKNSQLARVDREMDKARLDGALNITPDEQFAELQHLMQMDRSLREMSAGYEAGDIFAKSKTQFGRGLPSKQDYVRQAIERMPGGPTDAPIPTTPEELTTGFADRYGMLPMDPQQAPAAVNAIREVSDSLSAQSGQEVTPTDTLAFVSSVADGYIGRSDWGRLLAHHDIAQGDVNAIEGAVRAGGTADSSTFEPFRDYWSEENRTSADYLRRQGRWQKMLDAGKFDAVRESMTEYVNSQRDAVQAVRSLNLPDAEALRGTPEGLLQEIAGDVKGITMTNPDETGRYLTKLFKTADLSTLLHEHTHLLRMILPDDLLARVRESYPKVGETENGTLTAAGRAAEEAFVTDLQRYVQDKVRGGDVKPTSAALFTRVASLLEDSYPAFLKTAEGQAVPNDIAAFWDRMFNPDLSHPDALHDPLSAQYVKPGPGVNIKQFQWETDAEFAKRARQYGEARGAREGLDRSLAQAKARATSADNSFMKIAESVLNGTTEAGRQADDLHARAISTLESISAEMDVSPTRRQIPPEWRNFMESLHGLREAAKADETGGTAEILAEVPETFSAALQFAAERGFEPQYIPDMTWATARKFMMNHLRIDGEVDPDSMRKENTGALSRAQMADRSMEALGAGFVKATRELYRGRLVDFVEKYYAKQLPGGQAIPEGWTTWSPEKTAIITGRSVVPGGGEVAIGDQYIVPKEVASALKSMRADYSQWTFRMLMKSTTPWKTLILTLSPAWYLKHFMGAVMLATAEGVKVQDWKTAWGQFKTRDLPEVSRGRSVYSTLEDPTDPTRSAVGSTFKRETFGEGGTLEAEGVRIAAKEVNNRLRGIVKTVDALARAAVFAKTLREGGSYEYAVTRTYEAIGDFGNLSPFERDAVQAVVPFYAFQKAMLRVLLHVASDHPLATGTLMQLGRMHNAYLGQQLGGSLPSALIGAGIVGGPGHKQLVGYQKMNPLTDSWTLLTPEGIAASLNPMVQLLTRQAFHYQSFNDKAGMGSYGQLQPQQDWVKNLQDVYLSSPLGGALTGGGKGFNVFNPAKVYSPTQLAALKKRIAKTMKAIQLVNEKGGYLATDANPPTSTGAANGSPWGK